MILKRPLNPRGLRSAPPSGFGWIDHRFLREGYLQRCSPPSLALYCLLICAGDAQGLSFYSEPRAAELLGLAADELRRARHELIEAQLIAFQKPLYQVLALDGEARPPRPRSAPGRLALAPASAPFAAAPPAPSPRPPRKRLTALAPRQLAPAPAGLDLRAMVQASLRKGGVQ